MSVDKLTDGDEKQTPCTGFAPDALPENLAIPKENSPTGVSTKSVRTRRPHERVKRISPPAEPRQWYALRCTYGREKTASEYMASKHVKVFHPLRTTYKLIKGKRTKITESYIPNLFFAYGTEREMQSFVYDNVNLPFLRFYYRHDYSKGRLYKVPLVVPDAQIESLRIITAAGDEDIIFAPAAIPKFQTGQLVRITGGTFEGVVGRVARYQGQQRVAVEVDGLVTAVTAYVPKGFLKIQGK